MNKQETNQKLASILTTLHEEEDAAESTIYLALGCNIENFELLKDLLVKSGMVVSKFNRLSITSLGRTLANKINEFAKGAI
jgi:hypothetical protein